MPFRKDFLWGAATASYQIEGGAFEGGRGASVWDVWSHQPGNVLHDDTGDTACDHYHRFREDVGLMAQLGIPNYRFSISWPRLLPEGTGEANPEGLAFYDALLDELAGKGIRPFVTLFHWDLPQALEARGGWMNPDSPAWFADYAELCARHYGSRVKDFITFNEPQVFVGTGYQMGKMAPGLARCDADVTLIAHHVLKAHGLAVERIRGIVPDARIGYAPCGSPYMPASDSPADIEAARQAYFDVPETYWGFSVSLWSDPVVLGRYPETWLRRHEASLPRGWERDMPLISRPIDFYAQNIYYGKYWRAAGNERGREEVPLPAGAAKTAAQWAVTPEALYWGPRFLWERYRLPFLITENGMSSHDWVALDGGVHDPARIDFTRRYLRELRRTAEDGVDVIGYFHWSLMDNYEWARGYSERFGLIHVDFQTQRRTVKDSARWYSEVIRSNGETL